jgi:hypothetical protein
MRERLVILNNEILPYRIPLFRALAHDSPFDLHVLYCARRAWDRHWDLKGEALAFEHTVMPGFSVRLRKPEYDEWRTVFINPTLMMHLARLRPQVIIGYEYSAPALTAMLYARLRGARYIVTEGHTTASGTSPAAKVSPGDLSSAGPRLTRHEVPPRIRTVWAPHASESSKRRRVTGGLLEAEADRLRPRPPRIRPRSMGFTNARARLLLAPRQRRAALRRVWRRRRGPCTPNWRPTPRVRVRQGPSSLGPVEPQRARVLPAPMCSSCPRSKTRSASVVGALASGVPVVCRPPAPPIPPRSARRSVVDPTRPSEMAHAILNPAALICGARWSRGRDRPQLMPSGGELPEKDAIAGTDLPRL